MFSWCTGCDVSFSWTHSTFIDVEIISNCLGTYCSSAFTFASPYFCLIFKRDASSTFIMVTSNDFARCRHDFHALCASIWVVCMPSEFSGGHSQKSEPENNVVMVSITKSHSPLAREPSAFGGGCRHCDMPVSHISIGHLWPFPFSFLHVMSPQPRVSTIRQKWRQPWIK